MKLARFLDIIYPPLCRSCGEKCSTKYLCSDCWALCELLDPVERCRHCFEELDQRGTMCSQCRIEPLVSAVRGYLFDPESPARCLGKEQTEGLAGFAFMQWVQLEWPEPAAVIPMPDSHEVAMNLAKLLNRPFVKALDSHCGYEEDLLEEDQKLLLIDLSNSLELLKKAVASLREAFPKRIYLLSLLP